MNASQPKSEVRITLILEKRDRPGDKVTKTSKVLLGQVEHGKFYSDVRRMIRNGLKYEDRYSWLRGSEILNWKLSSIDRQAEDGFFRKLKLRNDVLKLEGSLV